MSKALLLLSVLAIAIVTLPVAVPACMTIVEAMGQTTTAFGN